MLGGECKVVMAWATRTTLALCAYFVCFAIRSCKHLRVTSTAGVRGRGPNHFMEREP